MKDIANNSSFSSFCPWIEGFLLRAMGGTNAEQNEKNEQWCSGFRWSALKLVIYDNAASRSHFQVGPSEQLADWVEASKSATNQKIREQWEGQPKRDSRGILRKKQSGKIPTWVCSIKTVNISVSLFWENRVCPSCTWHKCCSITVHLGFKQGNNTWHFI